jgi:hypothetical protein
MSVTPAAAAALDVLKEFIGVANELAKLPALLLPQYQPAARDLYEICQKLLKANESLSRWLYGFLYFDFRQQDAHTKFLALARDYETMKQGPEFKQLKFSCADIRAVFDRDIGLKLGNWLSNQAKLEEAREAFAAVSAGDRSMVDFIYCYMVPGLDSAVERMEQCVDSGAMDAAEAARLQIKAEMGKVTQLLEKFTGELSDLVILFAGIAHVPVTLGHT